MVQVLPRSVLATIVITSLVLVSAGPVSAKDDPRPLTAKQRTCLRHVLSAREYQIAMRDPVKLSPQAARKALRCVGDLRVPGRTGNVVTTGAWIVANPVDLASVTAISLFRSCMGHDFSGGDVAGVPESDRSMKHYVISSLPLTTPHSINGYAPFDGTVSVTPETTPLGKQVRVTAANGWTFVFFHGDPVVADGQKVAAGELVTQWPPADLTAISAIPGKLQAGASFDIALVNGQRNESPLLHMSPEVASVWAEHGFTPESAILPKAYRDAHPCNGVFGADPSNLVAASSSAPGA